MSSRICFNCKKTVSENAKFCGHCRTKLRCHECNEILYEGLSFCENCGAELLEKQTNQSAKAVNEIEYDGKSFKAKFTDTVGKDVTNTFGDIFKHGQLLNQKQLQNPLPNQEFSSGDKNIHSEERVEDIPFENADNQIAPEYPSLKVIVMKNLPSTEVEWVLIYSFYASNYGNSMFTRQQVLDLYDSTNRKTESRMKNLTYNLTSIVKSDFINPVNTSGDFSMLSTGIKKAIEILNKESGASTKPKSKGKQTKEGGLKEEKSKQVSSKKVDSKGSSTKSTKKTASPEVMKIDPDLNLMPKGKVSLEEFYASVLIKSSADHFLFFAYYLISKLELENVNLNHIYTCFKEVKAKIPEHFRQAATDVQNKKGWLNTNDKDDIKLTQKGENEIEFKILKNESK